MLFENNILMNKQTQSSNERYAEAGRYFGPDGSSNVVARGHKDEGGAAGDGGCDATGIIETRSGNPNLPSSLNNSLLPRSLQHTTMYQSNDTYADKNGGRAGQNKGPI